MFNPYYTGPSVPADHPRAPTPDRQEIIRKIKKRTASPIDVDVDMPDVTSLSVRLPSPELPVSPRTESHYSHPHIQDQTHGQAWEENALAIRRPGSALHQGDFRQSKNVQWQLDGPLPLATSPIAPWFHHIPARPADEHLPAPYDSRRATVSHTPSSSFAYQPPTSPLVQQSNAADIPDEDFQISSPVRQDSKRHVSSPLPVSSGAHSPQGHCHNYNLIRSPRDTSLPYKAHQPRFSIGSVDQDAYRSVFGRSRKNSLPGRRSSMVGSFEESILMGRMSSHPSAPLDFTAQIGVLGLGDCKASLKCPAHIAVPFPAVFYSYGLSSDTTKSQPSPYVGQIDLEGRSEDGSAVLSRSSVAPPGAYRIPAKGQLQVVLKNPHKTAVKLFLVPYDVSAMAPGQRTFIRQRSVSTELPVVVDMPLSALKMAPPSEHVLPHRTIMRYMIQLHICCPSKGRYYLYKSIRVVFANRVPDGKEKLHNDIQLPEPRFSPYKPIDPPSPRGPTGESATRRRCSDVLPSKNRDVLRLTTGRGRPDILGDQTAVVSAALTSDTGEDPAAWMAFVKREPPARVSAAAAAAAAGAGTSETGDETMDVADGISAGSSTESLLVKRLRDLGMPKP